MHGVDIAETTYEPRVGGHITTAARVARDDRTHFEGHGIGKLLVPLVGNPRQSAEVR